MPRPLWIQVSVMCVSALPPANHERTNQPTREILSSKGPRPENCTTGCFALPLLHQHLRFALLGQERPHQICRDSATTTKDGRPTGGRGRRSYGFGRNGLSFFHLCFLGASYSFGGGCGGEGAATEPALGYFTYRGGTVTGSLYRLNASMIKKIKINANF